MGLGFRIGIVWVLGFSIFSSELEVLKELWLRIEGLELNMLQVFPGCRMEMWGHVGLAAWALRFRAWQPEPVELEYPSKMMWKLWA